MKPLPLAPLLLLALGSCSAPAVSTPKAATSANPAPTAEVLDLPRLPVADDRRVLQTLAANLDQDAAEEQIIVLQSKANLSLPATIEVADYDQARKTYYLAWQGTVLASASQPLSISLEDLIGDHQQEVVIQGLDEAGHPSLDVLRPLPPTGNLGFAYKSVFSRVSRGSIRIDHPARPEVYAAGQNSDVSDPIVVEEPDTSKNARESVRTTYRWLFQKGEYVADSVERFLPDTVTDAALEKLFAGETTGLEAFLQGPWVKAVPDKGGLIILFFDTAGREITFATSGTQEVYHWQVSNRSSRGSLYVVGGNDLIELIRLSMSVSISAADTIEVNALDNPSWSGTYKKLEASAARALARQGTEALAQDKPPVGVYRNDKGDEFDFQVPQVRLKLAGVEMTGDMALYPLGSVTVLQIKVPTRPGSPGLSKVYSVVAKEEASTSRVVRTLRLQAGTLTAKGWISDQSDPLRLEQVEGTGSR